jgi:hypothetical protein
MDQRKEVQMRFLPPAATLASVAIATILALSSATAGATELMRSDRFRPAIPQDDTLGLDCVAEATAFTEVADLAYLYRDEDDVFAGALFDLREQLLDCLATSGEEPAGQTFMPGRQKMTAI